MVLSTSRATLYKRDGVYYLNWRELGKRWRRSLGKLSAQAAEKIRAAKDAELTHGVKIISTCPTLEEFIETHYLTWLESVHPRSTAKFSLAHPRKELGHFPLDRIPPIAVEGFKSKRLTQVKSATVNKEIRMLKAVVHRAVEMEVISVNPIAHVRNPRIIGSKAITFFNRDELELIYAAGGLHKHLWKFMVNTGLRRAEMAKATKQDVVDVGGGNFVLHVESIEDELEGFSRRTKSGRMRTVPLNSAALDALEHLGADRLVNLTPNGITQAWQYMRERAEKVAAKERLPKLVGGVHKLRHTFISHMVMAGVDIRTVQELAGHSSVTVTERYSHLAPGRTHAAVHTISL